MNTIPMRKGLILFLLAVATTVMAGEHAYLWDTEFPNYKSQIPSSDFTTGDGLFRFTSDKANGISGPQFGSDSKAGLLLRLYADNTLRIESLSGEQMLSVTFVIGGNGHYKLAHLTPSVGQMGEPYLGKDATDTFREYRLFWSGETADVTFTVGHECEYGIDCADQEKEGEPGTCMTKQIIITTADTQDIVTATNAPSAIVRKALRNGRIIILRGDKSYTLTGQEMKK